MENKNEIFAAANAALPDPIRRLYEAGYYQKARLKLVSYYLHAAADRCRNQPQEAPDRPEDPVSEDLREKQTIVEVWAERMDRLQAEYTVSRRQAIKILQELVRDFTPKEFDQLDAQEQMDWRFIEGKKRYIRSFADTLLATHPDLAARQIDPPAKMPSWERYAPQRDEMQKAGSVSADIAMQASIRIADETFDCLLKKAKEEGRDAVHVRAWLPIPAACPAQSRITLDAFSEPPASIAPEDAPQRTVYWEADLTENRSFTVQYSYRSTAYYADPMVVRADPVQPAFCTEEELPHLEFTPYLRSLAAQITKGAADPVQKARRIYDYVTLNVHYFFQPPYIVHENIADSCARNLHGDCGMMAALFIALCRISGIPAQWQSGLVARPELAGCHDWAMFYIAPKGWMYADCSAGASMARAGNEVMRLHYFGNLDTDRMVANRALSAPLTPPMETLRADPCDNQVGELEADGHGLYGACVVTEQKVLSHRTV